jgi:hypothetical protein
MDTVLKTKLQNLTSNPGYIITRPLATSSVQAKKGEGTRFIDNAVKLESVEVLIGNGNDRPKGTPKISTGDYVYIKSDRYTQPWARERITTASLEESIDGGKTVPLQFIVVPINEVVFVSSLAVTVDYSESFKFPRVDGYSIYWPNYPNSPPVIYGDTPNVLGGKVFCSTGGCGGVESKGCEYCGNPVLLSKNDGAAPKPFETLDGVSPK